MVCLDRPPTIVHCAASYCCLAPLDYEHKPALSLLRRSLPANSGKGFGADHRTASFAVACMLSAGSATLYKQATAESDGKSDQSLKCCHSSLLLDPCIVANSSGCFYHTCNCTFLVTRSRHC
eukprot:4773359-Amphidinium_carterae.1